MECYLVPRPKERVHMEQRVGVRRAHCGRLRDRDEIAAVPL